MTTKNQRQVVTHLLAAYREHHVSARRAWRLIGLSRSRWHYRSCRGDDTELRERRRQLAAQRPRWGYQQLHILLRREGRVVNHKKVLRLYREEGLAVLRRRRKKRLAIQRVPLPVPSRRTERWSMDFIHDQLTDGRPFRCFALVDDFTRECVAIGSLCRRIRSRLFLRTFISNTMNERKLAGYAKSALIGAAIGAFLEYTGAIRHNQEYPDPNLAATKVEYAATGSLTGAIAGLLFWRLRFLRNGSRIGHYSSWAVAVGAAFAIVGFPQALTKRDWVAYIGIVLLGGIMGLGCGFVQRRAAGHDW